MQITPLTYAPVFTSNSRTYVKDDRYFGTMTFMFRDDLDWKKFTKYAVQHFKDKEKVNFIQLASSDGSEAYTQIITLLENYPKVAHKFLPIKAFDIDEEVIKAAQSGKINLTEIDIKGLNKKILNKYFIKSDEDLIIDNDYMPKGALGQKSDLSINTYNVSKILTDNVIFKKNDMHYELMKLKDESNSIILCRNILGYLNPQEVDLFTDLLSLKLKKDSLFVIGELDTDYTNIDDILLRKRFLKIMNNVYQKI